MDSAPTLRAMRWWDIAPLLVLEHDLFPEDAWSAGMFWSELAEPETHHYVVAEDASGTIVGYAGLAVVGGDADVQTIGVRRDLWGTGLGADLLADLLAAARKQGCGHVLLEVRVDNVRAQRLYERFGFEALGIRRGYYQPADVDALVMRCDLSRAPAPAAPAAASAAPSASSASSASSPDSNGAPAGG